MKMIIIVGLGFFLLSPALHAAALNGASEFKAGIYDGRCEFKCSVEGDQSQKSSLCSGKKISITSVRIKVVGSSVGVVRGDLDESHIKLSRIGEHDMSSTAGCLDSDGSSCQLYSELSPSKLVLNLSYDFGNHDTYASEDSYQVLPDGSIKRRYRIYVEKDLSTSAATAETNCHLLLK